MENEKPELRVLSNNSGADYLRQRGINRRQMVQRLLGGAGAGFAAPVLAVAHPVRKHLMSESTLAAADAKADAADWSPEFLDAHQNDTLIVLAERIIPGSTAAQSNRFIDLLLSVDTQENQKKFLASMGAFEAESISTYQHPYKDLTEEQQNAILTKASTEKSGVPEGGGGFSWFAVPSKDTGEPPKLTLRDHFENLKQWVAGAYYSSEVGMKELGWTGQVMWDSFPGCEHPEGHH
ncbi:MAG TPA: gluconate 2-dehydrogenase subunit 3 family protein [Terriglobia bacterium]|nr:gluconate 2-dehydrogenase subunit 3 family protein [Terriglobia bacterium]